jgi:hypothetical protein
MRVRCKQYVRDAAHQSLILPFVLPTRYALRFGDEGAPMSRPFGVALLIAGEHLKVESRSFCSRACLKTQAIALSHIFMPFLNLHLPQFSTSLALNLQAHLTPLFARRR